MSSLLLAGLQFSQPGTEGGFSKRRFLKKEAENFTQLWFGTSSRVSQMSSSEIEQSLESSWQNVSECFFCGPTEAKSYWFFGWDLLQQPLATSSAGWISSFDRTRLYFVKMSTHKAFKVEGLGVLNQCSLVIEGSTLGFAGARSDARKLVQLHLPSLCKKRCLDRVFHLQGCFWVNVPFIRTTYAFWPGLFGRRRFVSSCFKLVKKSSAARGFAVPLSKCESDNNLRLNALYV